MTTDRLGTPIRGPRAPRDEERAGMTMDRECLDLLGLWSTLFEAKSVLDRVSSDPTTVERGTIDWVAGQCGGAAEVLSEIMKRERER